MKDSEELKKLVAKSLSNVIRYSTNQEMRQKCFTSLDVGSSSEAGEKLYTKLISMNHKHPTKNQIESNTCSKRIKVSN